MNFWILSQFIVNLVLFSGVAALWFKLNRPAKDDPRMSKGLQLLQTKISILEDLSDRTENQVQQLTALLEQKVQQVQERILESDKVIQKIEGSTAKSMEVAKIFQDRIPHQEIIERQNTKKYVKAARLAHQGMSIDEISKEVDLSRGELDFIVKVNKDNLQFSEDDLPEWAKPADDSKPEFNLNLIQQIEEDELDEKADDFKLVEPQPLAKFNDRAPAGLADLGNKFRQAVSKESISDEEAEISSEVKSIKPIIEMPSSKGGRTQSNAEKFGTVTTRSENSRFESMKSEGMTAEAPMMANNSKGKAVEIRKVIFPKVDVNDNLM